MVLPKQSRRPKVQRGISITPELNEAIRGIADALGKTWNDVAESALTRTFLVPDLQNRAEHRLRSGERDTVEVSG